MAEKHSNRCLECKAFTKNGHGYCAKCEKIASLEASYGKQKTKNDDLYNQISIANAQTDSARTAVEYWKNDSKRARFALNFSMFALIVMTVTMLYYMVKAHGCG